MRALFNTPLHVRALRALRRLHRFAWAALAR